jgi:transcriptional regulator with GAF, ATPase, and Fis domain
LQRIQELFPREEERNEDLQRLYLSAGVTPRYAGSAALPPTAAAAFSPASVPAPTADPAADVRSFTRVAEITRKLYQQSTAQAVLSTAVKEIGTHWEAFRCVATTGKPGQPPTSIQEFCSEEVEKASSAGLMELIASLQIACVGNEPLVLADALRAAQLQSARKAVEEMGVASMLAIPLTDGAESVGMLC